MQGLGSPIAQGVYVSTTTWPRTSARGPFSPAAALNNMQHVGRLGPRFRCVDCGKDTNKSGEYYMVRDEVWAASGIVPHGGMLCLRCLERRIGREINIKDFTAQCPTLKGWNKHVTARAKLKAKGAAASAS